MQGKINSQRLASLRVVLILLILNLFGCTSLGYEGRIQPQIEHPFSNRPTVVAVSGSGELAIAIELLLASNGIDVRASSIQAVPRESDSARTVETVARYQINVTSVDQDICIPEGSRQMHFSIYVVDLFENKRVFAMTGDYGCKNAIVQRFERWFFN